MQPPTSLVQQRCALVYPSLAGLNDRRGHRHHASRYCRRQGDDCCISVLPLIATQNFNGWCMNDNET